MNQKSIKSSMREKETKIKNNSLFFLFGFFFLVYLHVIQSKSIRYMQGDYQETNKITLLSCTFSWYIKEK